MSHIIIHKTEQDNAIFLYFFTLYLIHTILLFQKIILTEKDKFNIEQKLLNDINTPTHITQTQTHIHIKICIFINIYMYTNKLYLFYILYTF